MNGCLTRKTIEASVEIVNKNIEGGIRMPRGHGGPGRGDSGLGMPPYGGFHGGMHRRYGRAFGEPGMPPPRRCGCYVMPFMWIIMIIVVIACFFI